AAALRMADRGGHSITPPGRDGPTAGEGRGPSGLPPAHTPTISRSERTRRDRRVTVREMRMSEGTAGTGAEEAGGRRVRWGVLGVAGIARTKVIPAMKRGDRTEVLAIASRDEARARAAADELGIPRAYGSYEELLADPDVEVVYNALPNHLHVPWTARA